MEVAKQIQDTKSINLFVTNDGALVVIGRDNKAKVMAGETHAMAFMWAVWNVQGSEFKFAISELKRNRHSRAQFGILKGIFLFTDRAQYGDTLI